MTVIGAGLPRTGTLSQKLALEQLGLGPTYHWVNLITDLDAVELWHRALDGEDVFEEIFGGYQATVDWPGGFFYRELAERYPDAKVLLSVREPQKWEHSYRETIWNFTRGGCAPSRPSFRRFSRPVRRLPPPFRRTWGPFAASHRQISEYDRPTN